MTAGRWELVRRDNRIADAVHAHKAAGHDVIAECGCGMSYTSIAWSRLMLRGWMPSDTPELALELRDCLCHSTIASYVIAIEEAS